MAPIVAAGMVLTVVADVAPTVAAGVDPTVAAGGFWLTCRPESKGTGTGLGCNT